MPNSQHGFNNGDHLQRSRVTTQEDLEVDETSIQMLDQMEMVPIGKIEEVAKEELRQQRRRSSKSRTNEITRYGRSIHDWEEQEDSYVN